MLQEPRQLTSDEWVGYIAPDKEAAEAMVEKFGKRAFVDYIATRTMGERWCVVVTYKDGWI